MYYPSLAEVKKLASKGNLIPIYREVPADLETPVSAYMKVAKGKYSFLLESVEGGEHWGRYSFMGTQPYRVIKTDSRIAGNRSDPLSQVEKEISKYRLVSVDGLPRFHGGAVGYLAYEAVNFRVAGGKREFFKLRFSDRVDPQLKAQTLKAVELAFDSKGTAEEVATLVYQDCTGTPI